MVLDLLFQIIPTILILGVLIFVHELGHFLACRIAGVGVDKFSIGFGREILCIQGKKTRYSFSLIPFGGYVKPQGETFEEVEKRGEAQPGDYLSASRLSRFFILAAGVFMNFLFAFVLFFAVMVIGRPVLSTAIGGFIKGYPAEASGLQAGDEVTHLNGKVVSNWQDLTFEILKRKEEVLIFSIFRHGQALKIPVVPQFEEGRDIFGHIRKVPRVGITPSENYLIERYGSGEALIKAAQIEWRLTSLTFEALWRLVTGQLSLKAVSGPIGIVAMAGSAAKMGIIALLQFTAVLSVSLAVINVLPIPALDGGHLLFLLAEVLRGKPLSLKLQERVTQLGFYLLMVLMVFVVFNDLVNIGAIEKLKALVFHPQ